MLGYFAKDLTNRALNFCAFGQKTTMNWKFGENFRKFFKKVLMKIAKHALF